jgi:hypothetical protein
MFDVFHVNFGTGYQFKTFEEAKAFAIKQCFEAVVYLDGMMVAEFHPLRGFRNAAGWMG